MTSRIASNMVFLLDGLSQLFLFMGEIPSGEGTMTPGLVSVQVCQRMLRDFFEDKSCANSKAVSRACDGDRAETSALHKKAHSSFNIWAEPAS